MNHSPRKDDSLRAIEIANVVPPPYTTRTIKMSHSPWENGSLGAIETANVVSYLLFLGSSILTVIPPEFVYGHVKQTYLTPNISVFFVWPIIHILLLGTVVFQFTPRGKVVVVNGISWEFSLVNILYTALVITWANHYYGSALTISLFIAYVIGNIYRTLRKDHRPKSPYDELCIYLPFSACQAWAIVMACLLAFQALGVDATEHRQGFWTNIFALFTLSILLVGAYHFKLSSVVGERPAGFIFSWTLWAISDHQRSAFINGSAILTFTLSLVMSCIAIDGLYRTVTGRATHCQSAGMIRYN